MLFCDDDQLDTMPAHYSHTHGRRGVGSHATPRLLFIDSKMDLIWPSPPYLHCDIDF